MNPKKWKTIISWILAFAVSIVVFRIFLGLLGLAFAVMFNFIFIITIIILALPLYVIIRKKLFK